MALTHRKEDSLGLEYPFQVVWDAVPKAIEKLSGWKIERIDAITHRVKVKTSMSLWAWSTILFIDVVALDDNRSRVDVSGETGGQLIDYGKTRKRIELFFKELQKLLTSK